jgi:hypothetical protein
MKIDENSNKFQKFQEYENFQEFWKNITSLPSH